MRGLRAPAELVAEGADLLGADPEPVGILDEDLLHDVRAAVPLVGRQPPRGVGGALGLVRRAVRRNEVGDVVGERLREGRRPCVRALAPRVREGHDVVDLDVAARARAPLEGEGGAGVRVDEPPGDDEARIDRVEREVLEPGGEHPVAGVAGLAVRMRPGGAEEGAVVVGRLERVDDG